MITALHTFGLVTPPVRWAEVRQFGVAMFAAGRRPGVEWGMPFAAGMGGAGYPQLHLAAVQFNVGGLETPPPRPLPDG